MGAATVSFVQGATTSPSRRCRWLLLTEPSLASLVLAPPSPPSRHRPPLLFAGGGSATCSSAGTADAPAGSPFAEPASSIRRAAANPSRQARRREGRVRPPGDAGPPAARRWIGGGALAYDHHPGSELHARGAQAQRQRGVPAKGAQAAVKSLTGLRNSSRPAALQRGPRSSGGSTAWPRGRMKLPAAGGKRQPMTKSAPARS